MKNFEAATGVKIPYVIKPRRPGDIATCYSDASKAERELDGKPKTVLKKCAQTPGDGSPITRMVMKNN